MKKMTKTIFFALIVLGLTIQSCQNDDYLPSDATVGSDSVEDYVPLGDLMENPYEIHTFRSAFQQIVDSLASGKISAGKGYALKTDLDSTAIVPNYLYLRFDPMDSIQEQQLMTDKDIIFLDYPFEYEEPEDYKATLSLEEGEFLSYWCSVPIDQALPDVPYEVLQEMYLPEEDPEYNDEAEGEVARTQRGKVNDKIDLMNHVLEAAYAATDNEDLLPEPPPKDKGGCEACFLGINLRARWTPTGNLQIWDDIIGQTTTTRTVCTTITIDPAPILALDDDSFVVNNNERVCETITNTEQGSYIPLDGANVLARDTWTIASAITDSDGNWKMKRIRAKARFLIQWDRYEFSIRDNTGVFQAEDKGPKLYDQPWNHRIRGGREEYRGHIFQTAMHFYYHDIGGLSRPPTNGFWKKQMKITAKEKNGQSFHAPEQATGGAILGFFTGGPIGAALGRALTSTIRISEYGESSELVYGVTIHELAHAQHWKLNKYAYNDLVEDAWVEPFLGGNLDSPSTQNADARRTLESWATGVEVFLTNMRYRRLTGNPDYEYRRSDGIPDFNNIDRGNYQWITITGEDFYTSAVFDWSQKQSKTMHFSALRFSF